MSEPLYRSRPGAFDIRPASQAEATRVAEGIWLSEGLSNSYLVVTREGRVVINTGMGFEAPTHKRLFDAVDHGPVRYILLTQAHVDHVGGVALFREAGTEIIAQANNRICREDDARIHPFRVVVELAGGAAVVAARAHSRLAAGDTLAAIHLAEMALAADPASRPGLEAYLAAHERLLHDRGGQNFWETGWLRHQIERTRRALEALS